MSVTDYTLSNCTYNNMRLRNVLYLVSKQHVKDIQIDNGTAFIQSLSENPVKINLNNIDFREESTVDDRYRFSKTLQATVNGYVNLSSLNEKYYAIIVTEDGTPFMINVDFPSDVTYVYTLSDDIDQTVITFSSQSNFPSLRLTEDFGNATECKQYTMSCIKSLKLVDHEKAKLDTEAGSVVLYNTSFSEVEFLRNEFTYTENFNGQYALSTIEFSIPLGAYKSSWHYNLLEWMQNRYSAVIEGCNGYVFAGFNHGLIPSYTIEGTGENAMINITLVESSSFGSSSSYEFNPSSDDTTHWMYVVTVDGNNAFECVSNGVAKYLLMAEADVNGNRTGKYMVLEGYESMFPSLNIIGTFDEVVTFSSPTCVVDDGSINTTLDNVRLPSGTCASYSLSASCSWNITNIPSGWTITPSSGEANTQYEIQVCNVSGAVGTSYIQINYCNKTKNASLTSTGDGGGSTSITPKVVRIDCTRQQVTFAFDSTCPITVTSIPSGLTYTIGLSTLVVTVPANETTSERTFPITVTDCHGVSETVSIIQSQMYEKWVVDDSSYICDGGDKYAKEVRYTGTTDQNYVMTDTVRKGELIESGSTDCQGAAEYRWYDDGRYYCDGNNKYHALLEQVRYGSGGTWQYTGNAKFGDLVGEDAEFCGSGNTTYSWSASTRYYCYSGDTPTPPTPPDPPITNYKFIVTYPNGDTSYAECTGSNETLRSSDITNVTGISSVAVGDCVSTIQSNTFSGNTIISSASISNSVTSLGVSVFKGCSNLRTVNIPNNLTAIPQSTFSGCTSLSGSVVIPNTVTTLGQNAFRYCSGVTSVTIGNNVSIISSYTFANCSGLTSITIPSGVTEIGGSAFNYCGNLQRITCYATIPPSLGNLVFNNTNNCPIYVPCESVESYKIAWSAYADRITCDNPYSNYKYYATYLTGPSSYAECTGSNETLTSFDISGGTTNLLSLSAGDCVTNINNMIGTGNLTLTGVTFGNSLSAIGESCFVSCIYLTGVSLPNSLISIGNGSFGDCRSIATLRIPYSVMSIGYAAFAGCNGLGSITVDNGNYTYDSRDNSNAIIETNTNKLILGCVNTVIPNTVTSIGDYAFNYCSGLTSISIPNSITSIGGGAFDSCYGLTSMTIPDSVTSIGGFAFDDCSGLTNVTIGSGVASIGMCAFQNCRSLTSITINATTVPSLGSYAFNGDSNFTIYVPSASVGAYKAASGWSDYASRIQAIGS